MVFLRTLSVKGLTFRKNISSVFFHQTFSTTFFMLLSKNEKKKNPSFRFYRKLLQGSRNACIDPDVLVFLLTCKNGTWVPKYRSNID